MACPHCGSWAVKADRSLAGRMVCGRCGRPLGRKLERSAGPGAWQSRRGGQTSRWWALLLLLLGVSTCLAWLAERRQQPPPPPSWPRSEQRSEGG